MHKAIFVLALFRQFLQIIFLIREI